MSYRYKGLPLTPFEPLFRLGDEELAAHDIRRMIADTKPGFPCRISLEDAEPGERVLLLPYEHQAASSPYKSSGPIFVRENPGATFDREGVVPPVLRNRFLSLRAYATDGMMVDADVIDGNEVETLIERLFARADVDYVHIHNARRGCFACSVERR